MFSYVFISKRQKTEGLVRLLEKMLNSNNEAFKSSLYLVFFRLKFSKLKHFDYLTFFKMFLIITNYTVVTSIMKMLMYYQLFTFF